MVRKKSFSLPFEIEDDDEGCIQELLFNSCFPVTVISPPFWQIKGYISASVATGCVIKVRQTPGITLQLLLSGF